MRILFCSSGPYSGSGYGTQVYHLMKYFLSKSHDVALIATDFGKLIDFREEPYTLSEILKLKSFNIKPNLDLPEYPIYAIKNNLYGWDVMTNHALHFKADAVIFFRDPWKILEIKENISIPAKLFAWIPIDHQPASETLIKCVRVLPNLVSMSSFGQQELLLRGLKNNMIYHSIELDPEIEQYRSKNKLSLFKKKYKERLDLGQKSPVILLLLTNNQFPSRKAIDLNLEGVRKYIRSYPDAQIIIHSNMSGMHNGSKQGIDMNFICQNLDFPPGSIYIPYGDKIVDRRQVLDLYATADILLHCSAGEGFGVPIIEAQYFGCSVITNNCTAMPEITYNGICINENRRYYVNNVNSFWYYPSPESICKALIQLSTRTPLLNQRLQHDGSLFIKDYFNIQKIGDQWLDIIGKNKHSITDQITISISKKE